MNPGILAYPSRSLTSYFRDWNASVERARLLYAHASAYSRAR